MSSLLKPTQAAGEHNKLHQHSNIEPCETTALHFTLCIDKYLFFSDSVFYGCKYQIVEKISLAYTVYVSIQLFTI